MGHTKPPLKIGIDSHGQGYARPQPFARERGEVVEVTVDTPCSVCFSDETFFDNKTYINSELDVWTPNVDDQDGFANFVVQVAPCADDHHPDQVQRTYSIKIGSGGLLVKGKRKHGKKSRKNSTSRKRAKKAEKSKPRKERSKKANRRRKGRR